MRNGFLWAAGIVLASVAPAIAQDAVKKDVPGAITNGVPPSIVTPAVVGDPGLITYFQPQPQPGFWFSLDYLLWWTKKGPVNTPLVTTSNNFADFPPGALGQPGTRVLFGDEPMGYGAFSGLRLALGLPLSDGLALEGSFFVLERRSHHFSASSNDVGDPLIGIPFFNTAINLEDALLTSNPDPAFGIWKGTASVVSHSRLQGWELNVASRSPNQGGAVFTGLAGLRILTLEEDLNISNHFTPLTGGTLTFLGAPVPAGTQLSDNSDFRTANNFYGGQVGGRMEWMRGAYSVNVVGKLALGCTQEIVIIDGSSRMITPAGVSTTVPGGIYAQTTNIGRYYENKFAVVPEFAINFGVAVTPNMTARIGYSFLYWSRVARPGEQIDRNIHESLIPTHQFFGTSTPDGRPAFSMHQSDYWAQGINFGLEFTY